MQLSRRGFNKLVSVLGLAGLAEMSSGFACSLSNVWADILKYVPVGLSAFTAILSILTGSGIGLTAVTGIVTLIKVGFADLQTAVAQYQAAATGQKTTLLGQVWEALTVVEANIQSFWANLTIPDASLSATVQGLLEVITTTLMGYQTQITPSPTPAPVSPATAQAVRMRAALPPGKMLAAVPVKRSVKQFREEFNAKLAAGGYQKHAI